MVSNNFTSKTITQQIANRTGQIYIGSQNGSTQFVDQLTGKVFRSQPVDSYLLANPRRTGDPKITSAALNMARGLYQGMNVPMR